MLFRAHALAIAAGLAATPVAAQDPVPPDTIAVDTTLAIDSTLAMPDSMRLRLGADTLDADSLPPPVPLPAMPNPEARDALPGVHVWDRDDLFRSGAVTLGELLARAAGVRALDIGYYAAPQALAGFAVGAGGVEVVLDGYPLDPLTGPTIDVASLPLVQLERVRLEQRADRIRIELETIRPVDPRPYTVVEAQAGEPFGVTAFRGLFLAPNFVGGPFAAAFERVGSDGVDGAEPSNFTNAWLRWSLVSDSQGVQLEFLNSDLDRGGTLPFTAERTRRDLIVRARSARLLPDAVIELFGGTSWTDATLPEPSAGATPADSIERTFRSTNLGARLGWSSGTAWARGSGLWRDADRLPDVELRAEAGLRPLPSVTLSGDVAWERWPGRDAASSLRLTATAGPFAGLRAFGSLVTGSVGIARRDTFAMQPIVERSGVRVGLGWEGRGVHLSAAGVALEADTIHALGPPFDSLGAPYPGGEMRGIEASASVPVVRDLFRLEGSYVRWDDDALWPYTPREEARAMLVLHTLPLESDNLEIIARAGIRHVGESLVPALSGAPLDVVPSYTIYDAYLHIRVVTVRAFVRFENMRGTPIADFPGRDLPGLRIIYGVKWELFN